MTSTQILGIIISILLSINGITLTLFVTNVRELKKVIQELSLAIKGSQKDIEFINKTIDNHDKLIQRHSKEIENLKIRKFED